MSHHFFDFGTMDAQQRYKLLCGIVVPRPIALVTSLNAAGQVNAAPFSFFNVFSEEPAQIVLGLQHRPGPLPKDTTRNLADAREFVVNMVDEPIAEMMNMTAIDFPHDESEIENLGIATLPSRHVAVPRIALAPAVMECRKVLSLAFSPTREILIAEVLAVHMRAGLVDPATLHTDPNAYRPIGRLAGAGYATQGRVFDMRRQSYQEWAVARPKAP